ncbi:SGNH/GDSL hydrolase family protein [Aegicerativicinus sediminis]|uniref:lipase n=1 Tax=Aegicerativicinus sediminis TaxID=2893202 RepID=UPI001E5A92D1|nr:lipase [Aegicerativicinus sediminis]
MKYRPLTILLFFIAVLFALFGFTYLSAPNKLEDGKIQDGFAIGENIIKYPTTTTFFMDETLDEDHIKEIDSIVENIENVIAIKEVPEEVSEPNIPDFTQIDTSKIQRIHYPENKSAFIGDIRSSLQSNSCRIIHYGDSQIEGDRISSYLRNRLQGMYGGYGPGFIPIVQVYEQISAVVTPSGNWSRYAYFDPTQKKFEHKKYGAYNSFSRFTEFPSNPTEFNLDTIPVSKATIDIGIPAKSYGRLKTFKTIGLHYGNALAPVKIKVINGGSVIRTDSLNTDGKYHKYQIKLAETPSNLKIELETKISPDFYGITLDTDNGISLDNVAMRGSSGTVFANTNSENFAQMYGGLNPKIVIFQYGGNSVPYMKDSLKVKQYVGYLRNHIRWVQRKTKNSKFIFIGPSDLTTMENGRRISYPLLPFINESLKEMCLENNVAYWSMFDAMGGLNSMPHWVDQSLAGSDYTHFTFTGSRLISEMFFLALYLDLNNS